MEEEENVKGEKDVMAVGRQGGENGIISHKLTLRLPFLRGALSVWKGLHNVPNALHRHCR